MFFIRGVRVYLNSRCSVLTSYSSSARICTSVCARRSEPQKENQPFPFMSKIKQNQYGVEKTFQIEENNKWKYQPHVVFGCLTIFLVYFLILREEHEVDWAIAKHMYEGMPGLEEQDLRKNIEKAKKKGKDTKVYEERLNVLLAEKAKS